VIAAGLALLLQACPPSYDDLVSVGVREGRASRPAAAAEALDRATTLCPERPEAWVERGGLRFLEGRYSEAAQDLRRGVRLHEDAYARELLASSLYLAGRAEEALAAWNPLGRPTVRGVTIAGLRHTREGVARRELTFEPGRLLTASELRASRRRLREVGVFDRVALRPLVQGDGAADVEAALSERHGWAGSRLEFAVTLGAQLLQKRAGLQYANLAGEGITAAAEHRFEAHRPQSSLSLSWPRPLGLPAYLRVRGWQGRQDYAAGPATLRERSRGATLSLRRVLGARSVGLLSLRLSRVTGPAEIAGAWDGRLFGLEGGLDPSLLETRRHLLEGTVRGALCGGREGTGRAYGRGSVGLRYSAQLAAPEEGGRGSSVLAAQARAGTVGRPAPLFDRFAAGAGAEMDLPLRGRLRAPEGIQDGRLLARSFVLYNLEWRRRLVGKSAVQGGVALFHDGARLEGTLGARPRWLRDVGAGLRLAVAGGPVLRLDYGRGLTDGSHAVSFGLDQAF
jgi:hypothetical protein